MTIGVDGGALSISDDRLKVGVYRVAYNLIREISRLDVKSFYRIYSFGGGEEGRRTLDRPNVSFVRLYRPGFNKIWQPIELLRHRIDAYLGISQSFPVTLYDVKKIGFIYDVGFLDHPEYYRESYYALTSQTSGVVKRSDHIITISHASKDSIHKRYGVPLKDMSVAYLGVDAIFKKNGPAHAARIPYFLFVGALKPGKNVPMMLRAFAEFLATSGATYDFILAGSDYWLDPGISATINALKLKDRVKIVGFLDDETLASYYRGAAAFVTVSEIEGFGLPAVEAMACGIPVIASDQGSYPEVVGSAGILVSPKDEAGLADALRKIVTDKALRASLSKAGILRAKEFRWRKFAERVLEVLSTVTQSA